MGSNSRDSSLLSSLRMTLFFSFELIHNRRCLTKKPSREAWEGQGMRFNYPAARASSSSGSSVWSSALRSSISPSARSLSHIITGLLVNPRKQPKAHASRIFLIPWQLFLQCSVFQCGSDHCYDQRDSCWNDCPQGA